jgi:hypothetical protein
MSLSWCVVKGRGRGRYFLALVFLSAAWPWKVRVGANSPSLWPDHVFRNENRDEFLAVVPGEGHTTISGRIVERRTRF